MSSIEETSACDSRWTAFCAAHPDTTLFQSPQWSSIIGKCYGFSLRVLLATKDGSVVGGFPFAHIEDFRGPRRVALAFADNVEPLPLDIWPDIERWVSADALPWTIRGRCRAQLAAATKEVAKHHAIALPSSFDEAWNNFHSSHRQHTRRGVAAGLVAKRVVGDEAIDMFYALHSQVRKFKFGLMPQSREFFASIADVFFPQNGFVLAAEFDGKVIATLFFIALGKTLYYKFGASALDSLESRPNNFLFTKAIEYAIESGFTRLDLGISDTDGLIRFKERMGGVPSDVFSSTYNPREKTEGVVQVERAFGEITKVLTSADLPMSAAQRGGELLYRFFT